MTQNSTPLTMTTLQPFPFHHYNLHKILHQIPSVLLPKPPHRNYDDTTHTSKKHRHQNFMPQIEKSLHLTITTLPPSSPPPHCNLNPNSQGEHNQSQLQSLQIKPPISSFELMRPFELDVCPLPTDSSY